jgi:hypothetical protein
VGRSSTYWLFAAACIIFTISVLALVSKGVRENNYHFDATNLTTTGQNERIAARANHDAILAVGDRCAGETNKSAHTVKVADYLLTMAADTDLKRGTSGSGPPMLLEAPNYILAAIVLSHQIAWARIALAEQERWSRLEMQMFQWSIVVIGAITTVLISIKAMSNER